LARITWKGAIYARAYYLVDGNGNTRAFASGGDANDKHVRVPVYRYFKDKAKLQGTNTVTRTLKTTNNKTYNNIVFCYYK
jgi:hypothetical protein